MNASPMTDVGDRFISLKETVHKTGIGRSTLFTLVQQGKFPTPKKLATRVIGFRLSEVDQWMNERPDVA